MTTYAITNNDGDLVSVGTVVADPLPDGLTATPLTADDAALLAAGGTWVDGAVVPPVVPPDPSLAVLDALATARTEAASMPDGSAARQAVEALATAVETLVQGG